LKWCRGGDGRKIGYGRQVFVNNCGKCKDYSYILCGFNVSLWWDN
jgi:hypothetical protein